MEHSCDLVERIGNLLFDDKTADVTLVVEGECLPAHRLIISTSCEYFRYSGVPSMLEFIRGLGFPTHRGDGSIFQ